MIKSSKLPVGQYQQDYTEMRLFIHTLIFTSSFFFRKVILKPTMNSRNSGRKEELQSQLLRANLQKIPFEI